ncbi:hypothetical protein SDRG_11114 [Saprolegnia diclina VS20]|uniref:Uncharacterized protein n=1 Tax=Saprolegnia diclina (strain VS20) TaxID=1156394 RepID=T0Q021_SAPDV|nr:hypothetical protein SDRG_11114 [Saprolegnia diclina VS20]EQC31189.1 hypothetical protein SDRG_11114 [Saprolegnia diclina VS20]|eukprot:XP_008615362.1 hypothetical protein SDRG_11114 [Saprolegnia diclina VS20]
MSKKRRVAKTSTNAAATPSMPAVGDVKLYEDALALLKPQVLSTPPLVFNMASNLQPLVRIDDDDWLGLPLCTLQATHVLSTYGNGAACAVVPGSRLRFDNPAWQAELDGVVRSKVQSAFLASGAFTYELAHLAIDTVGRSESLRPATRPSNAFGTLCIALPSYAVGDAPRFGAVPMYTSVPLMTARCALALSSTPISAGTITAGRRVLLVYHLLHDRPTDRVRAAAAAVATVARRPSPTINIFGMGVLNPGNLTLDEKAVVAALLPSHDLVIVEHTYARGSFTGGLATWAFADGAEKNVEALQSCIGHVTVQAWLYGNGTNPRFGLVFWTKPYRATMSELSAIARALYDHSFNPASDVDLFGRASVDDLICAVLPRFQQPHELHDYLYFTAVILFHEALGRLQRLQWLDVFFSDIFLVGPTIHDVLFDMGANLARDIATFGWAKMAPPLLRLIQRWATRTDADIYHGYRLVTSLAGVADRRPNGPNGIDVPLFEVCDAVAAPHLTEWVVDAFAALADGMRHMPHTEYDRADEDADIPLLALRLLKGHLLLEVFVARAPLTDRWLYGALPDVIVANVASFRGPRWSLAELCLEHDFNTMYDVLPALGDVLRHGYHPSLDKWIGYVLDAYDNDEHGVDSALTIEMMAALLALGAATNTFLSLLDRLAMTWRLAMAPAIVAFLHDWPTLVTPIMVELCGNLLLFFASDKEGHYVGRIYDGEDGYFDEDYLEEMEDYSEDASDSDNEFDPFDENRSPLLGRLRRHYIHGARSPLVKDMTTYAVLKRFNDMCPSHPRVFVRLADGLLSTLPIVFPRHAVLHGYALPSLMIRAPCCYSCESFNSFLINPGKDKCSFPVCKKVLAVVAFYPQRLRKSRVYSIDRAHIAINKVRQPGQATARAVRAHMQRQTPPHSNLARARQLAKRVEDARRRL